MKTKITNKTTTPVLAILALIIFGATIGTAAPGDLDTTFGNGGIVITRGNSINHLQAAFGMAIQSDGKIVAVGEGSISNHWDFAVVRYNTDGSLDASFGGTGIVITPVGGSHDQATSVAIQADGKIVVAGGQGNSLMVVRYHPNGSLDTSFNGTGIVVSSASFYGRDLAIQTDGKIVASGDSSTFNVLGRKFVVIRLNPNGSPDTTFGGTGKVTTAFCCQDWTSAVAIQSDGKIVVLGNTDDSLLDFHDPVVVRYQGGSNASIRTRFDFDGDGRADVSVFRPSDRTWYLNRSTQGFSATQFGLSTDKITPADYDGDGKTDISVFREGVWYRLNSSNGTVGITQFGIAGDIPQPADFTGDGRAELAVYRNGVWWTLNLSNNQVNTIQFGISTDKPVASDYDGDGRADQAVYRNGEWHLNQSSQGYTVIQFGLANDKLVPTDYDGDGKTDQAVYRDGIWYLLQSTNGFTAFQFGLATDIPAPADYDGDGKTDAAVYRNGTWYIVQSSNGSISYQQFGLSSDIPIAGANQ